MGHPKIEDSPAIDERQNGTPFRLQDDRLVNAVDKTSLSLSLSEIAFIRLNTSGRARLSITLEAIDGRKISLKWSARHPRALGFFSLSADLLTRVAQRNHFVTFSIGPSMRVWITAWIGLIISIGVILSITWVALTGGGISSVMLPMALAPIVLIVVVPILLNGPSRTVRQEQLINALAEHQRAANPASPVQTQESKD